MSCGEKRRAEHERKKNKPHLLRALASLSGAGLGAEPKKSASSHAEPIACDITEDRESTALASGSEKEKKVESENALLGSPLFKVRSSSCCRFWGMRRISCNVVKTIEQTPQRQCVFCASAENFLSSPALDRENSLAHEFFPPPPTSSPTSLYLPQPQPLFHLHKPQVQPARIRSHQHHGQRRQQALGEDGNHRRCRDVARE